MNEEFLHYIWKFRLFPQQQLSTITGESLQIVKTGEYNHDAGPDFFNAKLKIGATEWAGNVEIHINTSDWLKHKHTKDKAYSNIILHVVYNNDVDLSDYQTQAFHTLELKNILAPSLLQKYNSFKNSQDWIPCERSIHRVPDMIKQNWLSRLLVERLEEKANIIQQKLELTTMNWEACLYEMIAKNFGFNVNAVPFEMLSKALPFFVLQKHKNSLLQLEALVFGTAGMLQQNYNDNYLQALQNEYQFLQKKYKFQPMEKHLWKFLRLRPANFPSIRLAQFAALLNQTEHLFSKILHIDDIKNLEKLLNVEASLYWKSHFVPDKVSKKSIKKLGKLAISSIIINTIVPLLFVYGKKMGQEQFVDRALKFLDVIKPENNSKIAPFASLGFDIQSAYESQGLLQLKNTYCAHKRCLQCAIGNNLLKN
ncbi:MAG: DUF2851 family protein [Bacteroidetes bacterium]|nr:DUF2851 family protein [Bacteroidota bacterium]